MIIKTLEYLTFSGLSAFVGFLTTVYLTKMINVEDYGVIGLFLAILYVLPQVISFATIGLVSINKVKLDSFQFSFFSNKYLTFSFLVFLILFIISFLFTFLIKKYLILFIFLPLIAFVKFLEMFHNAELIQEGKSKMFGIYRLLLSLLSFGTTVVFISLFHLSWNGRLYAIFLSELITLMIMIKVSFNAIREFSFCVDITAFKEYLAFGFPVLIGLFAGWLLNQSDRFIILHFFSLREVGIYTLAYSIGIIVNMINEATTNAVVPKIYKHLHNKQASQYIKKLNISYTLIILSIALLVGITSYWYVPILFDSQYADAPNIIFFIAFAFAFNGIYRTTGSVIAFYKQNILRMKLVYISAALNVIISIVCIPLFGILAPAIGTMMAYMFLAISSYIYGWKILQKEEYVKISC